MQIVMEKRKKRGGFRVALGDSAMLIPQKLEENSVHAVITDPPY